MKYRLFFSIFFSLFVIDLPAQQFAKAAVVSLSRIYKQFYKESKAVREFDELKASVQEEIDNKRKNILSLNNQKQDALEQGDLARVEQLDKEMRRNQDEFRDFGLRKQAFLNQKMEEVKNDLGFYKKILEEVEQERIANGANIVLNLDDPMILNYAQDADITDGVIARLHADLRR